MLAETKRKPSRDRATTVPLPRRMGSTSASRGERRKVTTVSPNRARPPFKPTSPKKAKAQPRTQLEDRTNRANVAASEQQQQPQQQKRSAAAAPAAAPAAVAVQPAPAKKLKKKQAARARKKKAKAVKKQQKTEKKATAKLLSASEAQVELPPRIVVHKVVDRRAKSLGRLPLKQSRPSPVKEQPDQESSSDESSSSSEISSSEDDDDDDEEEEEDSETDAVSAAAGSRPVEEADRIGHGAKEPTGHVGDASRRGEYGSDLAQQFRSVEASLPAEEREQLGSFTSKQSTVARD